MAVALSCWGVSAGKLLRVKGKMKQLIKKFMREIWVFQKFEIGNDPARHRPWTNHWSNASVVSGETVKGEWVVVHYLYYLLYIHIICIVILDYYKIKSHIIFWIYPSIPSQPRDMVSSQCLQHVFNSLQHVFFRLSLQLDMPRIQWSTGLSEDFIEEKICIL